MVVLQDSNLFESNRTLFKAPLRWEITSNIVQDVDNKGSNYLIATVRIEIDRCNFIVALWLISAGLFVFLQLAACLT